MSHWPKCLVGSRLQILALAVPPLLGPQLCREVLRAPGHRLHSGVLGDVAGPQRRLQTCGVSTSRIQLLKKNGSHGMAQPSNGRSSGTSETMGSSVVLPTPRPKRCSMADSFTSRRSRSPLLDTFGTTSMSSTQMRQMDLKGRGSFGRDKPQMGRFPLRHCASEELRGRHVSVGMGA